LHESAGRPLSLLQVRKSIIDYTVHIASLAHGVVGVISRVHWYLAVTSIYLALQAVKATIAICGFDRTRTPHARRGTFNKSVTPFTANDPLSLINHHLWYSALFLDQITSTPSMPILENAQNTDARWATFNHVGGDQVNIGQITNNYDTTNAGAMQCYHQTHHASILIVLFDHRSFNATRSSSRCSV